MEEVGVFKPHPGVCHPALDRMAVNRENICFLGAKAWDARGVARFGFNVLRINRAGLPRDRFPGIPIGEIAPLAEPPAWLGP